MNARYTESDDANRLPLATFDEDRVEADDDLLAPCGRQAVYDSRLERWVNVGCDGCKHCVEEWV